MSDPFITVSVRMQKSAYEAMGQIAKKSSKEKEMVINVDAAITVACKNCIEEQSATGRQVTIKDQ